MLRLRRISVWLSQGLNVILLGGRPGEMTSGKLYRKREYENCRWCAWVCRRLNWLTGETDHCRGAYEADNRRARELLDEHDA